MTTKNDAWKTLLDACGTFDNSEDSRRALHVAALEYAQACGFAKSGGSRPAGAAQTTEAHSEVIRFGRAKGQTVGEAKTADLEWVAKVLRENVADGAKERFRESNLRTLAIIERELETR